MRSGTKLTYKTVYRRGGGQLKAQKRVQIPCQAPEAWGPPLEKGIPPPTFVFENQRGLTSQVHIISDVTPGTLKISRLHSGRAGVQ